MTPTERAARAVLDALNDRQPERVRELVTAEFVDHGAPPGLVPPGPDGYIAVLRFLIDVLQLRYEVHDVVADGDKVAIRATAYGVHNTDHLGVPATGRMPCPPCTCTGARATAWPSTGACATS
jgi:predicted ester cyclase